MRLLLIALAFVASFAASTPASAAPKALPSSFQLKSLKGKASLDADDLKGKTVVLQFWASWCEGCGKVMGILAPIVAEYKDALFVPVSVDESMNDAKTYFKKQDPAVRPLEAKAYLDQDAALATALKIEALPSVAIVNGKGKVLKSYTGHLSKSQIAEIKKILEK